MKRQVLTFCLLCSAMLTTGMLGASGASAVEFHSDSSSGNTWTTNTTTTGTSHKFDAGGLTITCTTASFQGTASGKTLSSINITPTYKNCTTFGVAVTVNLGNCEFQFTASGSVSVVDQAGLNCGTEGKTINYKATFLGAWCEIIIGEQTGLTAITYAGSTTANGTITVTPTVTGIAYQAVGTGCSKGGPQTDGNYTVGTTTMTGYVDESEVEKASTPIWAA